LAWAKVGICLFDVLSACLKPINFLFGKMKNKSEMRLLLVLIIAIAGIVFWIYRTTDLTSKINKIADLTDSVAQLQMEKSAFLEFQYSTSTSRAIVITSIWLAMCYGLMIAICVFAIYEEIKRFRKEKLHQTDVSR